MASLNDDDDGGIAATSLKRRVMDPDDEALLGTKLGEYRVDSVLGEGGMGIVFKGSQPLIKKTVAIKVLKRALASEANFASRLLDEARAVNAIHHPAIVDAFGFGQTSDGRPYIVMEFLQGEPLDARLSSKGPQSIQDMLKLLVAVLAPLEAAHAAGVIHRDLKPSNVFLQRLPDGTEFPRLLDFGLAKYVDAKGRGSGIVGTPAYMAPEQAKDGDITPAVDLYAVGCLAFELLAGRPPFAGASLWAVLEQHLTATPPALATVRMDVDDEVSDFVAELLAKDPSKRPTATQAKREAARMLRARADATTVSESRARHLEGPTPGVELGREKTQPSIVTPKVVDSQDASTVLGLGGVDVPMPAPKRVRSGKNKKHVVEPSARETAVDEPSPFVDSGTDEELAAITSRPGWLWPAVGGVLLLIVIAVALLLNG